MESVTLRVYERLRQTLGEFVGVAGFQSLASRALALARPDAPSLSAARRAADGSLQGLGESEPQIYDVKDQAGEFPDGAILIAAYSPCFLFPWRSFNVKPATQCVAGCNL